MRLQGGAITSFRLQRERPPCPNPSFHPLIQTFLSGFFAPMPTLIAAAEATKNLRIGTNVLNNDFRHPVLVAREAATVDLLTEGRFELGLGAGHMQSEYNQAGLNFDAGGIRVERLAEAVTLIKRLLDGEQQVTLAGRHYRVVGHTIYPLPVQRPHPPRPRWWQRPAPRARCARSRCRRFIRNHL